MNTMLQTYKARPHMLTTPLRSDVAAIVAQTYKEIRGRREVPGSFCSTDLALGLYDEGTASGWQAFVGKARLCTELPDLLGLDPVGAMTNFIDVMVAAGGTLRFRLDGFDMAAATERDRVFYGSSTSAEFRYVLANHKAAAVFYLDGAVYGGAFPG
jgi:hypothetical protein